ncbi:MAG: O-antigen ligase family protein [Bacteroidales bacterium]|nr:O-antigen ligase family protein [Candidatus Physcocola equi]
MVRVDWKNTDFIGWFSGFAFLFVAFAFSIPNLYNVAMGTFVTAGIVSFAAHVKSGNFKFQSIPSVFFVLLAMAALPFLHWLFFGSEEMWTRMAHKCFEIGLPMWLMPLAAIPLLRYCPSEKIIWRAVWLGVLCHLALLLVTYLAALCTEFDGMDYSAFNVRMCFECLFNLFPHRTYFSVDLLLGLVALWRLAQLDNTSRINLLLLISAFLFGVVIFFSGARVALLTFALLMVVVMAERGISLGLSKKKVLLTVVFLLFILLLLLFSHERVQNMWFALMNGQKQWTELDPRFQIWSSVFALAGDMPVWGYGCDMFQEPLIAQYAADQFEQGVKEQYSAHNQFLVAFLNYSWIGLILLCLFFWCFWKCNRNLVAKTWVVVLFVNFFFEHMLERSFGVMMVMSSVIFFAATAKRTDAVSSDEMGRLLFKVIAPLFVATAFCLAFYFVRKDKSPYFGAFRRYLTEVTDLPAGYPEELLGAACRRIDAETSAEMYGQKAYTFVRFHSFSMARQDALSYSAWIYVSPDFEGTKAYIALEGNRVECASAVYDLNRKGEWQQLHTSLSDFEGNVECSLLVERDSADSFAGMNGYLLFSTPKIDWRK